MLLINGEVVAEGEDIGTTLGTSQTFTMTLHSGGKDTVVDNPVTTGSMYAVTLDNQSITGEELQRVYDEAAALKDTVTENNVYSEAYLGKLLALAGKLYFAQVDIADMIAAEIYGVNQIRSLSEGITGYEVQTTSFYGVTTGISEGSLYIDVDTDSHSVVSLSGEEDTPREYMTATGMLSSLYESVVWEELTGIESVSTVSILAKAQEEGVEILLISKDNLSTEIEKLNTDETTKQTVINAVNSGKVVTIPASDITMGDWHGTGYIITNPETGAGAYMISGGLNGGAVAVLTTIAVLCAAILLIIFLEPIVAAIVGLLGALLGGMLTAVGITVVVLKLIFWLGTLFLWFLTWLNMFEDYDRYIKTGDLHAASSAANQAMWVGIEVLCDVFIDEIIRWLDGNKSQSGGGDTDDGNTSGNQGDTDDGNTSGNQGDTDDASTSGNKGDTDDGSASGNKGDTDGGSTSGNQGDTDDGSTSGNKGDVDDGTSGGTVSDGGDSTGGGSQASGESGSTTVKPSNPYDADAKPRGTATKITDNMDDATKRSLKRENEAAVTLAKNGYDIEQNPTIEGTTRKPDYLIEGEVFDCYSPAENTSARNIGSTIEEKVIKKGQANNVVLNLDDWKGNIEDIIK